MNAPRRYSPTINIWTLTEEERATLLPGQWVSAGPIEADRSNVGRFYGVKPSGSTVVAWKLNARRSGDVRQYNQTVRQYAAGK